MGDSRAPGLNACIALFAVSLALLCASCFPQFDHPLPPPDPLAPDPGLPGTWESRDPASGEAVRLLVFARHTGLVDLVVIGGIGRKEGMDHGVDVTTYEGYTTTLDADRFLCFREKSKDSPSARPALMALYRLEDARVLSIHLFTQDRVKELIQSGKLAGTIEKGKFLETVTVTASEEALAELIRAEGVKAFIAEADPIRFQRMGPGGE